MFLKKLSDDNQKRFLPLAYCAVMANNVLAAQEQSLLSAYALEVGVPSALPELPADVNSFIEEVNANTTKAEKNIITIELVALVCVDGDYDQQEQDFVKKVANVFGITKDKLQRIKDLIDDYAMIFGELNALIVG